MKDDGRKGPRTTGRWTTGQRVPGGYQLLGIRYWGLAAAGLRKGPWEEGTTGLRDNWTTGRLDNWTTGPRTTGLRGGKGLLDHRTTGLLDYGTTDNGTTGSRGNGYRCIGYWRDAVFLGGKRPHLSQPPRSPFASQTAGQALPERRLLSRSCCARRCRSHLVRRLLRKRLGKHSRNGGCSRARAAHDAAAATSFAVCFANGWAAAIGVLGLGLCG